MHKKYDKRPIDPRMIEKRWYKKLPFQYKWFIHYLIFKVDDIGVWKIDLEDFYDSSDRFLSEGDINLEEFAQLCNKDKERIMYIDKGKSLFFTPTVLFRNCDAHKGRFHMVNNKYHPYIIQWLSVYKEVREWFVLEVCGNEGDITIKRELLDLMIKQGTTPRLREFISNIAKSAGFNIDINKVSQSEELKKQYGHQCQYCGGIFSEFDLEIDEIKPQSQGGKKVKYNQVPACTDCNRKKGAKNVFTFMDEQGFEWLPGLENKVNGLVKKRQISYPRLYPYKRKKKKEKSYTWAQVSDYVLNTNGVSTSDYQCINPNAPIEDRRWVKNQKNTAV